MEGSQDTSGGVSASTGGHGEDPAARAERLFDSLIGGSGQGHTTGRAPARQAVAADAPPVAWERPPPTEAVAAQGVPVAPNGDASFATPVGPPATTAEILALGRAMEQALEAINRRLHSIEHILLGEPGPNAGSADLTMAKLRLTLLRPEVGEAGE